MVFKFTTFSSFLFYILIFSVFTYAEKGAVKGTLMKNTNEMVNFSCLPRNKAPALKTSSYEIKTAKNSRALDSTYLEAVISSMNYITNMSEASSLFKKPIYVEQIRGGRNGKCYNFSPGGRRIQLVSGCGSAIKEPYEYAVRHFIHEMGHLIGQENGNYAAYMKSVKKPCMLSSYGVNNTNQRPRQEEFAEVFRGVIFDETKVRSAGGSCPLAADFFKNLLKLKSPKCSEPKDLIS